jgi:hypothetical protein
VNSWSNGGEDSDELEVARILLGASINNGNSILNVALKLSIRG